MLPRRWMLTIKILGLTLAATLLLTGCTPPGPRAFLEGKRLLEKGDYPRAVVKLKVATSLLQTNALAWNCLGVAYQHSGASADAEAAYKHALDLDRDLMEAHFNLGCFYLESGVPAQLDTARAHLLAFTMRRSSAEGLIKLGTAQLRLKETSAADKSFSEALKLSPGNPEALNGLALARLQRGRANEAAQLLASVLQKQPAYAPALLNAAVLEHQYARNRASALKYYRQYAALKPAPADADQVGTIIRQLERELAPPPVSLPVPPKPSHAATSASSLKTNPAGSLQTNALARTGTVAAGSAPVPFKSAVPTNMPRPVPVSAPPAELVKVAAEPQPKLANDTAGQPAANVSAQVAASAAGDPVKLAAIPRYAYNAPARPLPGNRAQAELAFAQGLQEQQKRRFEQAQVSYRRANQADPSFFKAHYNLAAVTAELGDLKAALPEYELALAIEPNSTDARYNFGLLLKQAGYFVDAVNEFEKVLRTASNESRAHLALANLFAQQLQQPAKARTHYLQVLDLDPHHPQANAIRYWLTANP